LHEGLVLWNVTDTSPFRRLELHNNGGERRLLDPIKRPGTYYCCGTYVPQRGVDRAAHTRRTCPAVAWMMTTTTTTTTTAAMTMQHAFSVGHFTSGGTTTTDSGASGVDGMDDDDEVGVGCENRPWVAWHSFRRPKTAAAWNCARLPRAQHKWRSLGEQQSLL
jgi:hypothetical protein